MTLPGMFGLARVVAAASSPYFMALLLLLVGAVCLWSHVPLGREGHW
jgi:uncharacterized membrane protein